MSEAWPREAWLKAMWQSETLKANERLLMLVFADFAKSDVIAWVHGPVLRQRLHLSRDAVNRALRGVEAAGWLVVEVPAGQWSSTRYRLVIPAQRSVSRTAESADGVTDDAAEALSVPFNDISVPFPDASVPFPDASVPRGGNESSYKRSYREKLQREKCVSADSVVRAQNSVLTPDADIPSLRILERPDLCSQHQDCSPSEIWADGGCGACASAQRVWKDSPRRKRVADCADCDEYGATPEGKPCACWWHDPRCRYAVGDERRRHSTPEAKRVTPVTTETETETEHASSFADEARNLSRPDRCRKHQAAAADTPCKPCAFAHKAWANSPTKKLIQLCPDCDALGGTLDSANSFESELCLHPRIGVA